MDPHLRKLERAAARGDEAAARRLAAAQLRTRTEPAWRATYVKSVAPAATTVACSAAGQQDERSSSGGMLKSPPKMNGLLKARSTCATPR